MTGRRPVMTLTSCAGDNEEYYSHFSRQHCACALAKLVRSTYSLMDRSPLEDELSGPFPNISLHLNSTDNTGRREKPRGEGEAEGGEGLGPKRPVIPFVCLRIAADGGFFSAALSVFISCRILCLSCCNSFCGPWAQGPRTQGPGTQRGHDETQEGKPQEGPRRAQGMARGGSQGRAQGGAQEGEPRRIQGGGRIESQRACSLLHGCDTIEPCMSSHIR